MNDIIAIFKSWMKSKVALMALAVLVVGVVLVIKFFKIKLWSASGVRRRAGRVYRSYRTRRNYRRSRSRR